MKKKLVMIIPPSPWLLSDTDLPFLGPLYISAYLKQRGCDVQVCDLSGLRPEEWRIPVGDVYGITGTSPNFPIMKTIITMLRKRDPSCLIIAGGVHASTCPEHMLKNTEVDYCIIGEGEKVMYDIVSTNFDIFTFAGVAYRKGERVCFSPKSMQIHNLDNIPFPDIASLDFYRYSESKTFKYLMGEAQEATIMSSRGCPFKCSFCASNTIWGNKVRYRSVGNVVSEIQYMKERFGTQLFYFIDDTFILNRSRVLQLCEAVKPLGVKWHCLTRVDKCDKELFVKMKESGCLGVVFGFESGSNRVLKAVNKGTTTEQAYKAVKMAQEAGLRIRGQLMVGLPHETSEDVEETKKFILTIKDQVDTLGLHIFQPFPGTDAWKNSEKYGLSIDKNTNFDDWHTIGNYQEINAKPEVLKNYSYLLEAISSKNIENFGAKD